MHRARLAWLRLAAAAGDTVALAVTWLVVVYARAAFEGPLPAVSPARAMPLGLLVVPLWVGVLHLLGSYQSLRRKPALAALRELISASMVALGASLAVLFLARVEPVSRTLMVGFAFTSIPALIASRWVDLGLLRALRRRRFDPHRVLLVGPVARARPWLDAVADNPDWGIEVADRLSHDQVHLVAERLTQGGIDEVYLTGEAPPPGVLDAVAEVCGELGVALSVDGNFLGSRTGRADLVDYDGWNLVTFSAGPRTTTDLVLKRALDVALATAGLALLGPVVLALAAIVRAHDGGPAFFVQERVGRYGRRFAMIKLRTMVPDAGLPAIDHGGPVPKPTHDPRITAPGWWLRRTSLDELPQLVNVLRGEMSLVGPRPPLPAEVARYERWQLRRLSVRPGITGSWQVSGRADLDPRAGTALDLAYIDNWSLGLDLRLLARTIPAVVRGTGAR